MDWVQYISSPSDSEGDEGYRPREGDTVGPLEPDPILSEYKLTSPAVVVWDRELECREVPNYHLTTDDPSMYAVPISIYNVEDMDSNPVVGTGSSLYGELDRTVFTEDGWKLRFPYYWDGVSPHVAPTIRLEWSRKWLGEEPESGGFIAIGTYVDNEMTIGAFEILHIPATTEDPIPNNGRIDHTFDISQTDTFLEGWNEFRFNIFMSTAGDAGLESNYGSGPVGVCWHVTKLGTSMPLGYNFEFVANKNFRNKLGIEVVHNITRAVSTMNGEPETPDVNLFFPSGFSYNPERGTRWKWEVHSVNPSIYSTDLTDHMWWESKFNEHFLPNSILNLPVFIVPENRVGPTSLSGSPYDNGIRNFLHWHPDPVAWDWDSTEADDPANHKWSINTPGYGMVWPIDQKSPGTEDYWYFPYNTHALVRLVEGEPDSDFLGDVSGDI